MPKQGEGVYLHLFHGREDPEQDMDDWGEDGPIVGPFDWFHVTYKDELKGVIDGDPYWFPHIAPCEDMIYFRGKWYGDWSIHDHAEARRLVLDGVPLVRVNTLTPVERYQHCSRCRKPLSGVIMHNPSTGEPMDENCFSIQFGANYDHRSPYRKLVDVARKIAAGTWRDDDMAALRVMLAEQDRRDEEAEAEFRSPSKTMYPPDPEEFMGCPICGRHFEIGDEADRHIAQSTGETCPNTK